MEDDKPTQERLNLTPEQVDDIGAVYYNGLRVTLASYLLKRLLMALAMQIVNDSTSDRQFQYENAKHLLDEFRKKSKGGFEQKRQVITKEDVYKKICEEAENLLNSTCENRNKSLEKIEVLVDLIYEMLKKQLPAPKEDAALKEPCIMKLLEETENLSNGTCQDNIESLDNLRNQIVKVRTSKDDLERHCKDLISEAKNLQNGTRQNKIESLKKIISLAKTYISKNSKKQKTEERKESGDAGSENGLSLFEFTVGKLEEHTLLPDDVCKMIRVAAVHEECLCMEPRWFSFEKVKISGLLFGKDVATVPRNGKTINKKSNAGDTAHPQNPMELIRSIFLERNEAAHTDTLCKTSSIGNFMAQLHSVDRHLKPYFPDSNSPEMSDEDKKKNLKLLFGDCDAIKDIDEIYSDMKATYPNFEKKVKNMFKSLEDGVSDAEDEEAWSLAKMYYDHHPNSCEDNRYYTMLLKRIKNRQKILDNNAGEDYQPLQHLRALHELDLTNPEKADESVLHVALWQQLQELLWSRSRQILQNRLYHLLHYSVSTRFERDNMDQLYAQYLIARRPPHPDLVLDSYIAELHD